MTPSHTVNARRIVSCNNETDRPRLCILSYGIELETRRLGRRTVPEAVVGLLHLVGKTGDVLSAGENSGLNRHLPFIIAVRLVLAAQVAIDQDAPRRHHRHGRMSRRVVRRIGHVDGLIRIVDMIDQQAMPADILVDTAVLNVLHHNILAVVVGIHHLVRPTTLNQR